MTTYSQQPVARYAFRLFFCIALVLFCAIRGEAEQAITCIPEPTDTQKIQYGNLLAGANCAISPGGDLDIFNFDAVPGEKLIIQLTDLGGSSLVTPCVTLLLAGQPTPHGGMVCNDVTARIDETITQTGNYTILVQ